MISIKDVNDIFSNNIDELREKTGIQIPPHDDRLPDKRFIDDLRAVFEKHGVILKTPWENGDHYYFMSKAGRFSVPIDNYFNREVLGHE